MQSRVLAVLIAVVLALVATAALVVYVNGADRRRSRTRSRWWSWWRRRPSSKARAARTRRPSSGSSRSRSAGERRRRCVPLLVAAGGQVRRGRHRAGRAAPPDPLGEANELEGQGLLPIPDDSQALSIGLDITRRVAGFVTPGDNVGMLLTLPNGDGSNKTKFLLQNVRVLAVGATPITTRTAQGGGGRVNQGKGSQSLTAITLAIKKKHVERVVHAAEDGRIYLTLMPRNATLGAEQRRNRQQRLPGRASSSHGRPHRRTTRRLRLPGWPTPSRG